MASLWQTEKRRLKREAWDREQEAQERERNRKAALSMWERIEEADLTDELKDILHRLAQGERED